MPNFCWKCGVSVVGGSSRWRYSVQKQHGQAIMPKPLMYGVLVGSMRKFSRTYLEIYMLMPGMILQGRTRAHAGNPSATMPLFFPGMAPVQPNHTSSVPEPEYTVNNFDIGSSDARLIPLVNAACMRKEESGPCCAMRQLPYAYRPLSVVDKS